MGSTPHHSPSAQLKTHHANGVAIFTSSGDWTVHALENSAGILRQLSRIKKNISIQWDVSAVGKVDSAGMMLFIHSYDMLAAKGCSLEILGANAEHKRMYRLLRRYTTGDAKDTLSFFSRHLTPFTTLGKKTEAFVKDLSEFFAFIGENFIHLLSTLLHPRSLRFGAIVKNIEEAGVRAIPIVAMISFLIGMVIAYQGAVQLERFGANIFIVDMVAISVSRELAPLITAIVVAGRTGSSYTAQLGVMKITEEIDAMRIMGFEPHRFLVLPRIIALIIALPLMIFFADIIGIGAGLFIAHIHLDISYAELLQRLQNVLDVRHVWIGIVKGPFFAWLIASVSCFYGFKVSKNTESIGRFTTTSVVTAIFLVIACDALFSVIFTELGI